MLDRQDGPVILVGHSYGGTVITEAGADPRVVGRVYLAAFGPDEGKTTGQYLPKGPLPIKVSKDGLAFFDRDAFLGAFAPDVERMYAKRMKATTEEVAGGHVAFVSHPDVAAHIIEEAAIGAGK